MKSEWQKYAAKIDALSLRERIAVFGAVILLIFYVAFMAFLDPAAARKKALTASTAQQRLELQTIRSQIAVLEAQRVDPDAANLARRNGVRDQLAELDLTLKDMNQNLVPAQRMKAMLQDVLTHQPRLQLVSMRTLPVAPLIDRKAKTDNKPEAAAGNPAQAAAGAPANAVSEQAQKESAGEESVFKHGVEITLQGSYADLYEYLVRVEKLPWRMFWSRASLNAEDYPRLKLTVTIYTLSLDKAWLVV